MALGGFVFGEDSAEQLHGALHSPNHSGLFGEVRRSQDNQPETALVRERGRERRSPNQSPSYRRG